MHNSKIKINIVKDRGEERQSNFMVQFIKRQWMRIPTEVKYVTLKWLVYLFMYLALGAVLYIWLSTAMIRLVDPNYKDERLKLLETVHAQEPKRSSLAIGIEKYLNDKGSPMAEAADELAELKNWKRIIALSNAESSFCKRIPAGTYNCWGVKTGYGDNGYEVMGKSFTESVKRMDYWLSTRPLKNDKKYADWKYTEMNGVYKQPAANHWLVNIYSIEEELNKIK